MDDVSMGAEEAQACLAVLGLPDWDTAFQTRMGSAKWQDKVRVEEL
jgi:hypothetical protein